MFFEGDASREYQVQEMVDEVKTEIKKLMNTGLKERKAIFS